jgi:adenosylcobinamide-GDP ribazoletransferase
MTSFLLALQFLTIVPLKIKEVSEKKIAGAVVYFPFVGLLLGLALSGINMLLLILNLSPLAVNIILAVTLTCLTGGMHLDGLSDTADAFLSGKSRDEMLAIMADPHIGVMGVLSVVSVMLLKVALLSAVAAPLKTTGLVLACVLSRWSSVLAMFLFPYARKDGKAGIFMRGMNLKIFALSSITAVLFAFAIWQLKGILTLLIAAGCVYLGGKFATMKIKGITGDTLGAAIELTEIIVLFAVCIG